jgi:hypothetical protein
MYQHLRQTGRLLHKSIGLDRPNVEAGSERLWNQFAEFATIPSPGR